MRIWSTELTVAEGGVVLALLGGTRAKIVSPSLPLFWERVHNWIIFGGFPMKCVQQCGVACCSPLC